MGAYAPLTPEAPLQAKSASHIKNGPAPSQATSQTLNYTPASTTVTNITPTNTKPTNALSSAPIPGSSNITPFSPGAADRASENNPEKNRKPKLGAIWRVEKVMVPECPSCGRGFGYEDGE
jgi:hypothetical protein